MKRVSDNFIKQGDVIDLMTAESTVFLQLCDSTAWVCKKQTPSVKTTKSNRTSINSLTVYICLQMAHIQKVQNFLPDANFLFSVAHSLRSQIFDFQLVKAQKIIPCLKFAWHITIRHELLPQLQDWPFKCREGYTLLRTLSTDGCNELLFKMFFVVVFSNS